MILLLAGTGEARELAAALAGAGVATIASLAGVTARPAALPVPVRSGGFGGADGFRAFLRAEGIRAVIDATHPFADRITRRSAAICGDLGLPYLRLARPGWQPGPGDDWRRVRDIAAAAAAIPDGARAFLATGRQSLPAFAETGAMLFARVIDPPARPFPFRGDWVVGRPPFPKEEEVSLFTDLRIDLIVAKDAGGAGNRGKLDAARRLGLPVVLVDRPPAPPGPRVDSVAAALDWAVRL